MSGDLVFLATVSASEEIGPLFFKLAIFSFAISGLCVLLSGGLRLFAERRHRLGMGISALGLLLSLVSFTFAWYVRHIDFQPAAGDGTQASPSLIEALLVPFMPVLLNAGLLLAHRKAGRAGNAE